jgi:hypothetical protein
MKKVEKIRKNPLTRGRCSARIRKASGPGVLEGNGATKNFEKEEKTS